MIKIKVLQEFLRDSKTNSSNLVPLSDLVSQYNEVLLDSPYMTLSKPYELSSLSVNNNRKDFDFPYCDKDFPGTVYKGVLSDIFRFLEDVELYFWDPYAFKFGTGWFVPVNYSKNKEFDPETIISALGLTLTESKSTTHEVGCARPSGLITSAKPVSSEKEHNRVLGRFEYKTSNENMDPSDPDCESSSHTLYYIGSYRASGFFRNYAAMLINRKLDLNNLDKSRTLVNTVLKSQELSDFVEVLKYYYDLGYKKVYCYDIFSALSLISEGSVSTYCRNLPNRNYRGESIMNNKVLGENIFHTTEIFLKCLDTRDKEYFLSEYGKSLGITEHEEKVLKVLRSCFDLREKCVTIEKLESTGLARDELARCFGSLMIKIENFQVMFFNLAPISNILFGETLVYNLKVSNHYLKSSGKWDFSTLNDLPDKEQIIRRTFKRI